MRQWYIQLSNFYWCFLLFSSIEQNFLYINYMLKILMHANLDRCECKSRLQWFQSRCPSNGVLCSRLSRGVVGGAVTFREIRDTAGEPERGKITPGFLERGTQGRQIGSTIWLWIWHMQASPLCQTRSLILGVFTNLASIWIQRWFDCCINGLNWSFYLGHFPELLLELYKIIRFIYALAWNSVCWLFGPIVNNGVVEELKSCPF